MGNASSKNKQHVWPMAHPSGYSTYPPITMPAQYPQVQYMQPVIPQMGPMQLGMMPSGHRSSRKYSKRSSGRRSSKSKHRTSPDFAPSSRYPQATPSGEPVIPGVTVDVPSSGGSKIINRSISRSRRPQTPYPGSANRLTSPDDGPTDAVGGNAALFDVVQPLPEANPEVFGPQDGRPMPTLSNPLPPPPRDLYELSPYKHILNLPTTNDLLLRRGPSRTGSVKSGSVKTSSSLKRSGSRRRGILRKLFGVAPRDERARPEVRFISVPTDRDERLDPSFMQSSNPQAVENITAMPQPVVDGPAPDMYLQPRSAPVTFADTPTVTIPPPPGPSFSTEPQASYSHQIRFNQEGPFPAFLNHSDYRVTYNNTVYPTATHLHEALKFLPGKPELAEIIRQTDITQVYTASADFAQRYGASEDWNDRFQSDMDMVLELKFSEHPNLRMQLLSTGDAELVYDDPLDEYWGSGANGNGSNQLGKALMRVRQYLKDNSIPR